MSSYINGYKPLFTDRGFILFCVLEIKNHLVSECLIPNWFPFCCPVNLVFTSDHGMSTTAPGTLSRTEMDDYLPPNGEGIENIADKGTFINIKVTEGRLDEVSSISGAIV